MRIDHINSNFHPREFIHNNINYRIKTSEAIGYFKMNQVFVLEQIRFNDTIKFSDVSKDIMLLKYDIWYDWLNEIEQIILKRYNCDLKQIKKEIIEDSRIRKIYYEDSLKNNFEGRDLEYIEFWINEHSFVYTYFIEKINELDENIKKEDFFIQLTKLTTEILRRTLYELQELEVLFNHSDQKVNLCIDNVCIELIKRGIVKFDEKIDRYSSIREINSVVIKNYSDAKNLSIACNLPFKILKHRKIDYTIL